MKRYKIIYYFNAYRTQWFVKAESEEDAINKFRRIKGKHEIISISEAE
jgi:hypothetical protein